MAFPLRLHFSFHFAYILRAAQVLGRIKMAENARHHSLDYMLCLFINIPSKTH